MSLGYSVLAEAERKRIHTSTSGSSSRNEVCVPTKWWHWDLKDQPELGNLFWWQSQVCFCIEISYIYCNIIQTYKLCLKRITEGILDSKIGIINLVEIFTHFMSNMQEGKGKFFFNQMRSKTCLARNRNIVYILTGILTFSVLFHPRGL